MYSPQKNQCFSIFVLLACLFTFSTTLFAQETLSFSVLNGTEIRCYPDSLVEIEITPNTDFDFTIIVVDWGDGTPPVQINPGDPLILQNEYPIAQFLEDCTYDLCGTTGGFCFNLMIDAEYDGTPAENISKRITFKFPPRPNFSPDIGFICAGTEVTMSNFTCPENDDDMTYFWQFPDGTTSTEAEPIYTFDTPGSFPVSLSATNDCDSITVTQNITVHELADAGATIDQGVEAFEDSTFVVCLSDGGKIRLNAATSTNATFYEWSFSPNDDFIFLDGDHINEDTLCLLFNAEASGIFTATLAVDNLCEVEDEISLQIDVVSSVGFEIIEQEDECLSLEYTPNPLLGNASYELNGTIYDSTDFPITLTDSNDPYIMNATVSNRCDTIIQSDTFFVFGQFDPTITLPSIDTTICQDTTLILLSTDGLGNNWQISSGQPLIFQNGQAYFDSNQPDGDYVISFIQGEGFGDCEGMDSRTITIQSPNVSLEGPWQLCEGGPDTLLVANPNTGTWSGTDIDSTGIFTPSTPGTYDVFYSFDDHDETGCMTTLSEIVEVTALPTASNVPDQFLVCDVDMDFLISDLMGISFNPNNGDVSWQGLGIINSNDGTYNPSQVPGDADTISFTYSITPGCNISDTIFIAIDSITPVYAGMDTTICNSEGNPILNATPSGIGEWAGEDIDMNTGEITIANLDIGQTYPYIYTINADFEPCMNSDTVFVTIADGQGVSIQSDDIYLCDTASTLVLPSGTPGTGIWQGSPNLNNDTLNLAALLPDTFQLNYVVPSLPAACNTATLDIYFSPQPTVSILSDSTACVDVDCLNFEAQTGGAEAFIWNFGDSSTGTNASTCHTYNTTGFFDVSLTGYLVHPITNDLYCASTPANTTIEVLGALEEVNVIVPDTSSCPDYITSLSPSIIDDHYTYSWAFLDITDSISTAIEDLLLPATSEDTTYLVLLTTTNGCDTQVDSISLTALAPLAAQIATDFDSPCSGETINLYNISTGVSGINAMWMITSPDNTINYVGFEPPAIPVFTDTLPSLLEVTMIDSNDCNTDTASYTIEVQPTDVRARMNFSAPEVCAGANLQLVNISTPGALVQWITSDGFVYDQDTVVHQFNEPGSAWVTIYAFGCGFDSLRYEFEVLPPPDLSLEYETIVCAESDVSFQVGGNATSQVLFYGTGDSTILNISTYSYPAAGDFPIRLIGQSLEGCIDSLEASISVEALPEAMVLLPDSVCANEPFPLISQSIGAESCIWRMADNGIRDNCESTYSFSSSGLKINSLIVASSIGCTDSIEFPVFVRPTPIASYTYIGSNSCSPADVQFTSTSTPLPSSWNWDFGDMASSNETNPLHTYPFGGTYEVNLIVGIDGICFDTLMEEIVVRGTPRFDTLTIDERCLPTEAFVIEVDTDPENEITITGNDYFQAGINRFEIIPAGEYELEILSPSGCDTVFNFEVPEVFPLEVNLMPDTTILLGASVRITNQVNATDLLLSWDPMEHLDDPTLLEPTAMPGETTTYALMVSNGDCMASDTVTIFVDEEIRVYFPNAFSPNGDGKNERYVFYPAIGVDQVLSFRIFSRWGNMVYDIEEAIPEIKDRITPGGVITWDGKLRGEELNPAVFAFVAELLLTNGETKLMMGDIHLVR